MNNVSSRLLYIFLLLLSTLQMHAQICPNAELQRQMQIEERSFLASMKPGLQHKQMLAVRAAIQGDDAASALSSWGRLVLWQYQQLFPLLCSLGA